MDGRWNRLRWNAVQESNMDVGFLGWEEMRGGCWTFDEKEGTVVNFEMEVEISCGCGVWWDL